MSELTQFDKLIHTEISKLIGVSLNFKKYFVVEEMRLNK